MKDETRSEKTIELIKGMKEMFGDLASYESIKEGDELRITFRTRDRRGLTFILNNTARGMLGSGNSVKMDNGSEERERLLGIDELEMKMKEAARTFEILQEADALNEDSLYLTIDKIFCVFEKTELEKTAERIAGRIKEESTELEKKISFLDGELDKLNKELEEARGGFQVRLEELKKELNYDELLEAYENARTAYLKAEHTLGAERKKMFESEDYKKMSEDFDRVAKLGSGAVREIKNIVESRTKGYTENLKNLVKTILAG